MRVEVDRDLCESNALCTGAAPEVFEVRDDDFLYLLTQEPPAELHDRVRRAEKLCPRRAVTVTD
ncbi:Ferredoxin-2 [Nocardiopsis dassonvillei]|uniref:ferredoxin n=1 Tax=Nocardiopsis dassonvillei TaxID=2014 RepID=UPI003F579AFD